MKTKIPAILCATMAALFAFGMNDVNAANANTTWNYDKEITEKDGAFTYHAIPSGDEKEVWIYEISVNQKKKHSTLSFPEKIDNKTVTRLGYTIKKDPGRDDSFNKNIFGEYVEPHHNSDGGYGTTEGIEKIIIPDSVEVIQPTTFGGVNDMTTIRIPEKVTAIEEETFYGCDRLETVYLPDGLKKLDALAFSECPGLKSLKLSSKNKVYRIKNDCVIKKKNKSLVFALNKEGTLKIPNGTKRLKKYALGNCTSEAVYIPASVNEIEAGAFNSYVHENPMIKDVTISTKNKTYARDGQCIYDKKAKSLSIGIPDSEGVLRISEMVENLTDTYSIVNCNNFEKRLAEVIYPANLKTVTLPAFANMMESEKVYFMGAEPPEIKKGNNPRGMAKLPVFTNVYVPEKSEEVYKKWYKEYKGYSHLFSWNTFNPLLFTP